MKALPVLAALVLSHSAAAADTIDIKGIRLGLEAAASVADCTVAPAAEIRALDPNTIAKDAK